MSPEEEFKKLMLKIKLLALAEMLMSSDALPEIDNEKKVVGDMVKYIDNNRFDTYCPLNDKWIKANHPTVSTQRKFIVVNDNVGYDYQCDTCPDVHTLDIAISPLDDREVIYYVPEEIITLVE